MFRLLHFHRKWIRFCRDEKFSGAVLEDKESKKYFNPQLNKPRINFAMPLIKFKKLCRNKCKSTLFLEACQSHVVYAIHCIRCGLMYVGETGRSLQSRINGHRAGIIKDGQSLLYKHFHLPGHSVADMKVQLLEKIYHSSENPVNIRLHRRLRELHWIKERGTASPYGCNNQIKGVGTLSSLSCKHTNVLGIFNKQQR